LLLQSLALVVNARSALAGLLYRQGSTWQYTQQ
jgi:hypothetical protein